MKRSFCLFAFCAGLLLAISANAQEWKPPTSMKKLPNGLTVVVSEDHSAPTFGICISYGIGFRLEPEGRTGFAHLFEHMMFEGTPNSPKGIFDRVIESGGGATNGDTRYDYTEYIETAPVSALDPLLWLEADRLKTLDFSTKNLENQRSVVEEEVRVNVMNQPYGLFFAIDLPGKAFDTYPNSHNFYGDFKDLDAAKIEDVQKFYEQYYAPNNAVLAIVGDVKPSEVYEKVEKYFAGIPSRPTPPRPALEEKPQTAERRLTKSYGANSPLPAVVEGYKMPAAYTPDSYPLILASNILSGGESSRLYRKLVYEERIAVQTAGIGSFTEHPNLFLAFAVMNQGKTPAEGEKAVDAILKQMKTEPVEAKEIEKAKNQQIAGFILGRQTVQDLAGALAHDAVIGGDPELLNTDLDRYLRVTPQDIERVAREYFTTAGRTVLIVETPKARN